MSSRTSIFGSLALGGVTIFSAGTAASARDEPVVVRPVAPEDQLRRTVSYRDLNLATSIGAQTLHRRVGYAVQGLCDEAVGPATNERLAMKCARSSWAGANPQIEEAIERAKQLATTGKSSIGAAAITISINP